MSILGLVAGLVGLGLAIYAAFVKPWGIFYEKVFCYYYRYFSFSICICTIKGRTNGPLSIWISWNISKWRKISKDKINIWSVTWCKRCWIINCCFIESIWSILGSSFI
jgi:hypothetical protein